MRFTVGQRILIAFFFIIAVLAGLSWFSLNQLAAINALSAKLALDDVDILQKLHAVENSQRHMRMLTERMVGVYAFAKAGSQVGDPITIMNRWRNAYQQTKRGLDAVKEAGLHRAGTTPSPERAVLWRHLSENARLGLVLLDEIANEIELDFTLIEQDDLNRISKRIGANDDLRSNFTDNIRTSGELVNEIIARGHIEVQQRYQGVRFWRIVALVLVVFLAIAVVYWLRRSITGPLSNFMRFAESVGGGDLTQATTNHGKDEFGELAEHLNRMVKGLRSVASEVSNAVENVNGAAQEILAATQQQASSMSEQSASIHEITSTMEEISQSGKQVTERASNLSVMAERSAEASVGGLEAVEQTGTAMEGIRTQAEAVAGNIVSLTEKTQSVGEIIATVNDIAERSKLLAFNAAIEAVGGGGQSERFGVVADEIKNLADQAKNATKQVKELLEDIQQGISTAVMLTEEAVKRAESGKRSGDNTKTVVENLAANVERSLQTLQQIVAATNQQQIAVEQVTDSVQSIRTASEQMTVGTRDLERAAANLTGLGTALRQAIARYRL